MAAIFLAEPIRPIQLVGGAIILAGVALLRRGSWPGRRSGHRRRAVTAPAPVIGPDGSAPPVPPLLPGEPPLAILVDYDGTVALTDVSTRSWPSTCRVSGRRRWRPTTRVWPARDG